MSPLSGRGASLWAIFGVEDLLWIGWLAILSPAAGEWFLEGGAPTVFLALASMGWWLAVLFRDREHDPGLKVTLISVVMAAIMLDVALDQLGYDVRYKIANTIALVVLAVVAAIQQRLTDRTLAPRLPKLVRRAFGWPLMMALAEFVYGLVEVIFDPSSVVKASPTTVAVSLLGVIPLLYAFFVVAPRRVIDPEAPSTTLAWVLRYVVMVAFAALGVLVVSPVIEGLRAP